MHYIASGMPSQLLYFIVDSFIDGLPLGNILHILKKKKKKKVNIKQ